MNNIKVKAIAIGSAVGTLATAGFCRAAADTDLADAIASTTVVMTDNKTQIIGFFAVIIVATLLIGLAKGALGWGKRTILTISTGPFFCRTNFGFNC